MHGLPGHEQEEHDAVAYRVTGRFAPTSTPWDRAILVPIEGVWKAHAHGEDDHAAHEEEPARSERTTTT